MRMFDIISKKKYNESLSKEEIDYVINEYTNGTIPDYQMSALLMAIYFNGMNYEETTNLTLAMAHSGDMMDLSEIGGINVDKHSTGGVGDKTTLILAPMVAACGGKVAKMSGRGLGNTGGTIDKLESIKGFRTKLSEEEFIDNIKEIGLALTGQTGNLAPADKKIYALRDVTAIVDSIPLIASSIMSKKIAAGAGAIVLDVKVGSGAFMKNMQDAEKLAEEMVKIGSLAGRNTIAVISDMDEPLGLAVGNALEVAEAVKTLKKEGPEDLINLCLELGTQMLIASKVEENADKARGMLQNSIDDGSAYNKFLEFIKRHVVFGKGENGNFTRLYWGIRGGKFFYPGRKDTIKACIYVKELVRFMLYRLENHNEGVELYNCTFEPAFTIEQIVETMKKVTGIQRTIVKVPGSLLLTAASIVGPLGGKALGICPARVKKLMISTNICGKKLADSGYKFHYTFEEAIKDWYRDNDNLYLK